MDNNELKRMEQESTQLLDLLREARDEDNRSFAPRDCKPYAKKVRHAISPYWLVAASLLGFVLGTLLKVLVCIYFMVECINALV